MNETADFRALLRRSLVGLMVCAAVVVVCYGFVDKPLALWVHRSGWPRSEVLRLLTYPPPVLEAWAPAVLAALVVRRAAGPFRRWQRGLLAAAAGVILADQFRESSSYCFGRLWPETWIDGNPSLIENGAYGFRPFHGGPTSGSFPSGHAARTLSIAAVVWIAWPRWRWLAAAASLCLCASLVGMNYHFLGDVAAGAWLGATVGAYAACFAGLFAPSVKVVQASSLP